MQSADPLSLQYAVNQSTASSHLPHHHHVLVNAGSVDGTTQVYVAVDPSIWAATPPGHRPSHQDPGALHRRPSFPAVLALDQPSVGFTAPTTPPNGASDSLSPLGNGNNSGSGIYTASTPTMQVHNPYTLMRKDTSMYLSSPRSVSSTAVSINAPPAIPLLGPTTAVGSPLGSDGGVATMSACSSSAAAATGPPHVSNIKSLIFHVGLPVFMEESFAEYVRKGQSPVVPPPLCMPPPRVPPRRNFPGLEAAGYAGASVPPPYVWVDPPAGLMVQGGGAPVSSAGGWSVASTDAMPTSPISPFDPPSSADYTDPPASSGGFDHIVLEPPVDHDRLMSLLYYHAHFFPPPPPPRLPSQERRKRVELWFHYASKWDITHRLPPPPRTPLPEMELEYRYNLQPLTVVPYHGNDWLEVCERWFDVIQSLFDFPEENTFIPMHAGVIWKHAYLYRSEA